MTPPAPVELPSLATPDDIVARLGRNLNQVEAARVDAMLKDGSAIIRRRAQDPFTYVANDFITISASDGIIVLPGRPVYNVISVVARSGVGSVPNMPVTWFIFDGIDQVTIPEPSHSGIINLSSFWYDVEWYCHSYDVVYEHGYVTVPEEIKGLLCNAIISELATPTQSATIQSESIGAYSYSMRRSYSAGVSGSAAMAGIYAALRDFGMEEILADFRNTVGSIPVRRSLCHILCSPTAGWSRLGIRLYPAGMDTITIRTVIWRNRLARARFSKDRAGRRRPLLIRC